MIINLNELSGKIYHQLINYGLNYCDKFLLVIRHSLPLSHHAEHVLDELNLFLMEQRNCSEWPGTILINDTAMVQKYHLNQDSIMIIKTYSEKISDWKQPNLPEDLCLLRDDGTPWLVSIVHEGDIYLEISIEEKEILIKDMPKIKSILDRKSVV